MAGSSPVSLNRLLVYGAMFLALACPSAGQTPPRISRIDDTDRVQVRHSAHPYVTIATDAGRLDSNSRMERMLLVLGPSDEMQTPLRALLDGLQDKNSVNYHAWLTPEQFAARFGPAEADVNQVAQWLQDQGFDHIRPARGRTHIEFSGSVGTVESAFGTEMHAYLVGTENHVANAGDISLPRGMMGVVRGVSLESFSFSRPALAGPFAVQRNASGELAVVNPQFTNSRGNHFLAPRDFAAIYGLGSLDAQGIDGSGRTIAIVARSNLSLADVEAFRQIFNLPPNDPNIILNGPDPGIVGGEVIEATLDAEWSGAAAPGATIEFVVSQSTATTDGVLLSAAYIVDNNLADVMSASFQECEQAKGAPNALVNALWQQAAAQGISVFVAAGDAGAAGCDRQGFSAMAAQGGLAVNGLASTPYNTAVGGTEFLDANSGVFWNASNGSGQLTAAGYIPEEVWNESCSPGQAGTSCASNGAFELDAGGGGVSTLYSKPSWQSTSLTGVPNDNQRDLPDVSLTAAVHDGYLICLSGAFSCSTTGSGNQTVVLSAGTIGGTSVSSPAFAGILARVDQKLGGRQGLANYVLYNLAAKETFANCNSSNRTDPAVAAPAGCVFNDVTQGNNGVPGNDVSNVPTQGALGYPATPGYDLGSGLGSVNAASLVGAWATANFKGSTSSLTATSPTSVQHGQTVNFSVSVSALGGSGVPTGSISLIALNGKPPFTGGTTVASGTLTNGTFSATVNSLPGGQYNVIARYPGDGNFAGSDSAPVAANVTAESSVVTVSAFDSNRNPLTSPLSSAYGTFFALDVAVTPASGNGVATGTVTINDGGTPIAQVALNSSGRVELFNCSPTFCLAIGSHSITASYSGDNSLTASTSSAPFSIDITRGAPILLLLGVGVTPANTSGMSSGGPLFEQLSVVFINVGNTPPSGTITFMNSTNSGVSALGPAVTLDANGNIPLHTYSLPLGMDTLFAQYSGDNNYFDTESSAFTVNVTALVGKPVQVSVTAPQQNYAVGQTASFTVTVTPNQPGPAPTGTISLFGNDLIFLGDVLGTFPLTNGSVTFRITLPSAGSMLRAEYQGDSTYASAFSGPLSVSVAKATPTLALSANLQTVHPNQQVTLVATVTPPASAFPPSGAVQLFDAFNGGQPAPFGTPQALPPSAGISALGLPASVAVPAFLPAGTHVFTAGYSGDNNYNAVAASQSTATVNVVGGTSPQTITFSAIPNPVTFGVAPVPLTATASSGLPVSYTATGPATVQNSTLTITGAGEVTITANQAGDSTFAAAQHFSQSITVLKAAATTALTSSSASAITGVAVTLTVSVTSGAGAVPTGPVQFNDGATLLATVPLGAQGTASFTTSTLAVGAHTISAAYPGDVNFTASTSNELAQNITDFSVSVSQPVLTLPQGQTQNITVSVAPAGGFNSTVSFSCGTQSLVTCVFSPPNVTPNGTTAATSTLMVTGAATGSVAPRDGNPPPSGLPGAAAVLVLVLLSLQFTRRNHGEESATLPATALGIACLMIALLSACGGSSSPPPPAPPPVTGGVTISATAPGNVVRTTTLTVTVTR